VLPQIRNPQLANVNLQLSARKKPMQETTDISSVEQMKTLYGDFYDRSAKLQLDRRKVPQEYWPLLPYREFWGLADDWARERLVESAPRYVRLNLQPAVAAFDSALDAWLAGPEADGPSFSNEYIAFSALRIAADSVQV
jgi:hypothetical protein